MGREADKWYGIDVGRAHELDKKSRQKVGQWWGDGSEPVMVKRQNLKVRDSPARAVELRDSD